MVGHLLIDSDEEGRVAIGHWGIQLIPTSLPFDGSWIARFSQRRAWRRALGQALSAWETDHGLGLHCHGADPQLRHMDVRGGRPTE